MSHTTTDNTCRLGITNHTECYDKLLYYTGGPVGATLSRVLSISLGEVCEGFSRGGVV